MIWSCEKTLFYRIISRKCIVQISSYTKNVEYVKLNLIKTQNYQKFFPSSGYLLLCKTKRTETWKAAKNKEYTYAFFALMSIGTCAFVEFFLIFINLIRNKNEVLFCLR